MLLYTLARDIECASRCVEQTSRRNWKCCCTHWRETSSVSAADESCAHRWMAFLIGTRLDPKKLPRRTEWYDPDPQKLSRQCHANLSVTCLRGINFMFRKHVGHTLSRASSLIPQSRNLKIAIELSLKIAGASTSRKRCILAASPGSEYVSIWLESCERGTPCACCSGTGGRPLGSLLQRNIRKH